MALSFYDLSVGTHLQILGGVLRTLERAKAHCAEIGTNPDDMLDAALASDMLPLRAQMRIIPHHSVGAIEALRSGVFPAPSGTPPSNFVAAQALIADARTALQALKREDVDALQGNDVEFQSGAMKLPFTGLDFILTFSLPNFYFHTSMAYAILRFKGVPLSKPDFMDQVRVKT